MALQLAASSWLGKVDVQLAMPYSFRTFLATWRKCSRYVITFGESSAKNDCFEDCISELPDEILALVLSYLTLKDAVKTRALSRRWRHLYLWFLPTSGSSLNFDLSTMVGSLDTMNHECQLYTSTFLRGVNNFLDHYKGPNISSISVAFCLGRKYASDIDRWITYVVKMDVEDLNLSCICPRNSVHKHDDQLYVFSFQLLSEATKLKHLLLKSCMIKPHFRGQYLSLKVLELKRISVSQSLLLCILSRCSNIERLELSWCLCPAVLSFRSPFLQLKLLTIYNCKGLEEIELSAAHLTNFELYTLVATVNIVFSSVINLKSVVYTVPYTSNISHLFNKMANSLPQLQSVSVLSAAEMVNSLPSCMSTFGNLKQLEIFLGGSVFSLNIRKINLVLSACPALQKFHLWLRAQGRIPKYNEDGRIKKHDKCLHTQLKEVEIGGFYCMANYLELTIFLLENAIALERMVITSREKLYHGFGLWTENEIHPVDQHQREWILEHLQGKATSNNAQVIVQ